MPATPPNPDFESELRRIAEWCGTESKRENNRSKTQIFAVIAILLLGLVLLLFLPTIIDEAHYFASGDDLPPTVIQDANVAQSNFSTHTLTATDEHQHLSALRDRTKVDTQNARRRLTNLLDSYTKALSQPLALFKVVTPPLTQGSTFHITSVTESLDGTSLVAGWQTDPSDSDTPFLARASDDDRLELLFPNQSSARIRGRLWSLERLSPDTFIAVGSEQVSADDSDISSTTIQTTLLLKTENGGQTWTQIKPTDPSNNNQRISGELYSILPTHNGHLLAAGYESVDATQAGAPEAFLLLHSTDGHDWVPIRPVRGGKRILGRLYSLLQDSKKAFYAAGFEWVLDEQDSARQTSFDGEGEVRKDRPSTRVGSIFNIVSRIRDLFEVVAELSNPVVPNVFLMRWEDAQDWTAETRNEIQAEFPGQVRAMVETYNGDLVVVGFRASGEFVKASPSLPYWMWKSAFDLRVSDPTTFVPILLRSRSSGQWSLEDLWTDGTSIRGRLHSVVELKNRTLIAAGTAYASDLEAGYSSELDQGMIGTLMVHLANEEEWNIRPPIMEGSRTLTGIRDVALSSGETILIGGEGDYLARSLSSEEAADALTQFQKRHRMRGGVATAVDVGSLKADVENTSRAVSELERKLAYQEERTAHAQSLVDSYNDIGTTFSMTAEKLEEALRKAEFTREVGHVATRLAVVGLLIYLVKILMNRYRYHLRLARFYTSRYQICNLIVAGKADSIFGEMSVKEVITLLSIGASNGEVDREKPPEIILRTLEGERDPR